MRTNRGGPVAWGLALGFGLAAGMLLRLVFDLGRRDVLFGGLALLFYASFLALESALVRAAWSGASAAGELPRAARIGLALAVPLGLLSSTLDCMGLSFHGCTAVCALLTKGLAPLVGALALLHGVTGASGWLRAAVWLSFGFLLPNCECRNPVNAFWIDFLGASPACFLGGFSVALVASSALLTRRFTGAALAFAWGTIALLLAFFVGHHYFDWPW